MNFVAKLPALAAGLALLSIIHNPTSKAADLPVVEEPVVFDWTGCYIGANAGFGWGRSEWSDEIVGEFSSDKPDGWLAGGQLGCNLQMGVFVLGAEGQLDWADLTGSEHHVTGDPDNWTDTTQIDWIGTLAVRAGFAFDQAFIFAKGGAAWVGAEFNDTGFNPTGPYEYEDDVTRDGYVLGGGLEYALSDHWTLMAEYEHIRLSDEDITLKGIDPKPGQPTELFHSDLEINLVKFGFNFKF